MQNREEQIEFFSKKTKRGILLLVFICLAIIYTPRVLSILYPAEKLTLTQVQIEQKEELRAGFWEQEKNKKQSSYKRREFHRPPRKFDPNEYSKEEWMYLGLSEKQANVVLKIAEKGIWSSEFLSRISVIPEEVQALIKDSVYFPEKKYPAKEYEKTEKKVEEKPKELLDINTATEEDLLKIRGIGPYFAKKILSYRDFLGGYHKKEQLLEVYNLTPEKLEVFQNEIRINSETVRKININTATIEELKKHPYIRYSVANSIVKMREQRKGYRKIEELKESELISTELFEKLKPYVYL